IFVPAVPSIRRCGRASGSRVRIRGSYPAEALPGPVFPAEALQRDHRRESRLRVPDILWRDAHWMEDIEPEMPPVRPVQKENGGLRLLMHKGQSHGFPESCRRERTLFLQAPEVHSKTASFPDRFPRRRGY